MHFGKFISGYFTHEYFFDIHPPLGKLMLSGMGYIGDFKPGFSFTQIGQKFPNNTYLWLRSLPTIAGALLPIIIYFLILQLGISRLAAFAGGIFIVLENATLVQSRFILLDPFLLLFGFVALLFYFIHKRRASWRFLLLSGIVAALAASVKWTGITFLVIIALLYLASWLKSQDKARDLVRGIVFLIVIPFVLYFSVFALHFKLLHKSGPGDAFMTPEFRKTLRGSADSANPGLKPLNILQKFAELNLQMYKSNTALTATHPYSSKWYTWPFMIRPIYYWNEASATTNLQPLTTNERKESRIYLLGNPIIWWMSTVAMFYLLVILAQRAWQWARKRLITHDHTLIFLAGAYILNLLPFIGIKRAMFLYHYFPALIFSIIALVYLIDKLKNKKRVFTILLAVSVVSFAFFAPLTYGLPLSESAYNLRVWLNSWL